MDPASPVFIPKNENFQIFRPAVTPQNMVNAQNSLIQEQKWRSIEMDEVMKHNFRVLERRYDFMYNQIQVQNFTINEIHKEMMKSKQENAQLHNIITQLQETITQLQEDLENTKKISPKRKWKKT